MNLVNLDNNIFGIAVPNDSSNFHIAGERLILNCKSGKYVGWFELQDRNLEILGTASLTEITFDCEPYVEKHIENERITYKDFMSDIGFYPYGYSKTSFYSLLESKGLMPTEETKILILKQN